MWNNRVVNRTERERPTPKPLLFVKGAREEISEMPQTVKSTFGYQMRFVQNGRTPANASPFEGGKASEVMKLTERFDGDTYRCVYAAKFEKAVYVLYVFQKKSKTGIATPQEDIDTVNARLMRAKREYAELFGD